MLLRNLLQHSPTTPTTPLPTQISLLLSTPSPISVILLTSTSILQPSRCRLPHVAGGRRVFHLSPKIVWISLRLTLPLSTMIPHSPTPYNATIPLLSLMHLPSTIDTHNHPASQRQLTPPLPLRPRLTDTSKDLSTMDVVVEAQIFAASP